MAAWTPTHNIKIRSYAAEQYPNIFDMPETQILTTTAERSFWEKATILHQEAQRPENSKLPSRYSRHYYDVYCMANSDVKKDALSHPDLLENVAEFKRKFYPRGWAHYENARVGSLKLMPSDHIIPDLKVDYENMRSMIYGKYPSFDEIMSVIEDLEKEINR